MVDKPVETPMVDKPVETPMVDKPVGKPVETPTVDKTVETPTVDKPVEKSTNTTEGKPNKTLPKTGVGPGFGLVGLLTSALGTLGLKKRKNK